MRQPEHSHNFSNILAARTNSDGPETAEEILALRQRLGLTHAAFARAVGVDLRTVKQWERGICTPHPRGRRGLAAAARREVRPPLLRR